MKNLITIILVIALCSVAWVYAGSESKSSVSVSATGSVEATPDIAIMKGRIVEEHKLAEQALSSAQIKLDKVIKYLLEQGVAEEDIQAAQVLINHKWFYPRNKPKELVGFEALANFTAKIRSIHLLSSVYSGLIDAGATEIEPTRFDFSNRDELELKAISSAVVIARKKAQAGLTPLGNKVGDLLNLNINTNWQQPVMYRQERAAMMSVQMDSQPELNVGNHTLQTSVNATFAVK